MSGRDGTRSSDQGSILVLVAGFVALAMLLIAVVSDVSALFLARRSLAATADGAAARAAQAVDIADLYTRRAGDEPLPVTTAAAGRAVTEYLSALPRGGPEVRVVAVTSHRGTVTVVLTTSATLPFSRWVSADPAGVDVTAVAEARTVVAQ